MICLRVDFILAAINIHLNFARLVFLHHSKQNIVNFSHSMLIVCMMPSVLHLCLLLSVFLLGAVAPTLFLSLFESDRSIGCLLSHRRCGPCARFCFPMSDVAVVNLCWAIVVL
jgi:hypothetical protein